MRGRRWRGHHNQHQATPPRLTSTFPDSIPGYQLIILTDSVNYYCMTIAMATELNQPAGSSHSSFQIT